jgi:hypothetical protein
MACKTSELRARASSVGVTQEGLNLALDATDLVIFVAHVFYSLYHVMRSVWVE